MAISPHAQMPRLTVEDITPGSRWLDISPRGRGGVVEVDHVTGAGRVQYAQLGRNADPSRRYMQPAAAFLASHALQRPAKPCKPRAEAPHKMPRPLRMSNLFDPDTRLHQPPSFELGSFAGALPFESEPAVEVPTAPPVPTEAPTDEQPRKSGTPPKLGRQQAREIYLLKEVAPAPEVAETYGVTTTIVHNIWSRRTYLWATQGIKDGAAPVAEPPAEPEPKEEAMPPVVAPPAIPSGAEADLPIYLEDGDRDLLKDLAAAVDVLLEWHGKPLPPFFSLNREALHALTSKARARACE